MMINKKSAFTMIELIVTLLIAGILAAISSVAYQKYLARSHLSEATVNLEALGKSEITYYLTHKSFVTIPVVPADWTSFGNTFQVPSDGEKLRVATPSGANFSGQAWWDLGKPIPDGTMVSFLYQGFAAKNNSAGDEIVDGYFIPSSNMYGALGRIEFHNHTTGRNFCGNPGLTSFPNNVGKPDASWAVLVATANFDNSEGDIPQVGDYPSWMLPITVLCTQIYKYVGPSETGKISGNTPLVIDHLGH